MRVLTIEGSGKERGRIQGQSLKPMISEGIAKWKANLKSAVGVDPDHYIDRFLSGTDLVNAVRTWTPDLLDEAYGIAEGTGFGFSTIFAYQCPDEELWYRIFERGLGVDSLISERHCSTVGCVGQDHIPSILSQNMDMNNSYDGTQVLLRVKNTTSSIQSYVFTAAGVMGFCGMNSAPLGVCVNTLLDLEHAKDGLPVTFIIRHLLESSTLNEAVDFLRKVKHASGQNYMLADARRVVDFECSGGKVCQFEPSEGPLRIWHTNHPLANDDTHPSAAKVLSKAEPVVRSIPRLGFLRREVGDYSKSLDTEAIKRILTSHEIPVCVHNNRQPDGGCTLGSLVMALTGSPELYLATQPPCSMEFERFRFD